MMCLTCPIAVGVDGKRTAETSDPECFDDFGYLCRNLTPLFVAKDRRTGMTFAAAVSMEGGGDPHAAR